MMTAREQSSRERSTRSIAANVAHVKLVLDILQGAGVAGAAGLRPFLPALASGGLAMADAGVDYDGTKFAFLESPAFLVIVAVAAVVAIVLERRGNDLESGTLGAFLGGIALGLGGVLCAGSIDHRHTVWWYGLLIGVACAALAQTAARDLLVRVRGRLDAEA